MEARFGTHDDGLNDELKKVQKCAARAFIRIITFHGEGDGRLLEARVLTNNA